MALTVYYEGQEKINTTLILSSENNLQSDGYIEIHWSFSILEQNILIFSLTVWVKWIPIWPETHGDVAFTRGIGTQLNHAGMIWMLIKY
jgi:hypothetical protein